MRVMILPDTHIPCMKRGALDFCKKTADKYQPHRIVHIGDVVDNHAISYHEKVNGARSGKEEFRAAKRQFHELVKAFPEADWLLGNHDCLPYRQAQTIGLWDEFLKGPAECWEVPWRVHERYTKLKIEGVIYSHGEHKPHGEMAAVKQACVNFRSTVIGHLHSNAGVQYFANEEFRVFGLSVGCLVDHRKLTMQYGRTYKRKPVLGCGIVEDGKTAHFIPWLLRSR